MKPNSSQYCGTVSRLLHWLMVIGFADILITTALWMIYDGEEQAGVLFGVHKSTGFILLMPIVSRLLWAVMNTRKRPPADSVTAKFGHLALYTLVSVIPVIDTIRQCGNGHGPLKVFGIQVMQGSSGKTEWVVDLGNMVHGDLGWLMFTLAVGHIMMVAVHRAQGRDVLSCMLGR